MLNAWFEILISSIYGYYHRNSTYPLNYLELGPTCHRRSGSSTAQAVWDREQSNQDHQRSLVYTIVHKLIMYLITSLMTALQLCESIEETDLALQRPDLVRSDRLDLPVSTRSCHDRLQAQQPTWKLSAKRSSNQSDLPRLTLYAWPW